VHLETDKGYEVPILLGKTASLSMLLCTQPIRCSIYVGAGIFVGRLKFSESCHKYSNLPPVRPKPPIIEIMPVLICSFHVWA